MALGPELFTDGSFDENPYLNGWYTLIDPVNWENQKLLINGEETFIAFNTDFISDANYVFGKRYLLEFDLFQFEDIVDYEFTYAWTAGNGEGYSGITVSGTFGEDGVKHFTHNFVATDNSDPSTPPNFIFFGKNQLGGVYFKNASFRDNPGNLFLQIIQMVGAETSDVQTINAGKSDDSTPIYYELETQGIEFGNVFHQKKVSDKIVVFTKDGMDSSLQGKTDGNNYKDIQVNLTDRVNIGQQINMQGNTFRFKWSGVTTESSPVFEGLYIEKITDQGIVKG